MAKEKNQGIRIFEEVFTPQRAEEILIEKNNLNRPLSTKKSLSICRTNKKRNVLDKWRNN
jgi:hypothetical protein